MYAGRANVVQMDLLSIAQVFVRTSVVFVLSHLFSYTDTSHSIVMVLSIAQKHCSLSNVKVRFMQAMKGLGFINAKQSTKIGSFVQFLTYTRPVGWPSCALQGSWKSQSVLQFTKGGLKNEPKCGPSTSSMMAYIKVKI